MASELEVGKVTVEDATLGRGFFKKTGAKSVEIGAGGTGSYVGYDSSGYLEFASITGADAAGYSPKMKIDSTGHISLPTAGQTIKTDLSSGGTTRTGIIELYNGTTGALSLKTDNQATGGIELWTEGAKRLDVQRDGVCTFSNGIAFSQTNTSATGATATGTTLDHYEEGTWTCTLGGVSGGNTTGYYTRVGDIVNVWFYSGSMNSDGSAASISGLPFAVSGAAYGGFFCYHNTYVPTANSGYFSVNNTSGYFTADNATASASSANATGRYLMFTGVYKVA